jgi:cytochrome c oxidase subunit 4
MASAAEHKHPNYIAIWIYLALLTGVELAVALLHFLPRHILIGTLIALAIWKALLVALFFMHLRFEPRKLVVMIVSPLPLAAILVLYVLRERFK